MAAHVDADMAVDKKLPKEKAGRNELLLIF